MKHLKKFESFNKIDESQNQDIMDQAKLAFEKLTPEKKEKVLQEVQQLADKLNCDVADLQDPKFVMAELGQVESKMEEGLMNSIMRGVGTFLKYLGIAVGTLGGLYSLVMSFQHLSSTDTTGDFGGIPTSWKDTTMTRTESFQRGWLYLLGAAVAVGAGYLLYKGGQATEDRWETD